MAAWPVCIGMPTESYGPCSSLPEQTGRFGFKYVLSLLAWGVGIFSSNSLLFLLVVPFYAIDCPLVSLSYLNTFSCRFRLSSSTSKTLRNFYSLKRSSFLMLLRFYLSSSGYENPILAFISASFISVFMFPSFWIHSLMVCSGKRRHRLNLIFYKEFKRCACLKMSDL